MVDYPMSTNFTPIYLFKLLTLYKLGRTLVVVVELLVEWGDRIMRTLA